MKKPCTRQLAVTPLNFQGYLVSRYILKTQLVGGDERNQKIDYLNFFSNENIKHTMYYSYPVETHPETLKDLNFKVEANYSVSLIIDNYE